MAEAVLQLDQGFDVQMNFAVNEHGKASIALSIKGAVDMQCQRCLEPVTVPLDIETHLIVVAHDEEAKSRIREWEPIVLEDGLLDIDAVIEEEILLSLPLVAMHPVADTDQDGMYCDMAGVYLVDDDTGNWIDAANANVANINGGARAEAETIERRSDLGLSNPFDVLKTLKAEDGQ